MLGCSIRWKEWIMDSGEIHVMARNKSTKKNNCRLDGIHWTSRCVDLVRGTRMTQYEIIEMAEQAGFDPHDMSSDFTCNLQNINAFAKLVAEKAIKEALAQPEQEPVAWISQSAGYIAHNKPDQSLNPLPLYLAPPQRTWVGLTDEDFQPMVQKAMVYYGYKPEHSTLTSGAGFYVLVRAIEAKLKQKNTRGQA